MWYGRTMNEIREELQQALIRLQYNRFTDVQKQTLPHTLVGEDVRVQAPAGSGKTLAYVLPVLSSLPLQGTKKHLPQALILSPTRELSLQIADVIRNMLFHIEGYRTAVLTGGTDIKVQIRNNAKGADIIVGTPSRILDHIHRHTLKLKECHILVLDEADEMLSMGFESDVREIISFLKEHQTMMFSATWNKQVTALSNDILNNPYTVKIEETVLPLQVKYHLVSINDTHKLEETARIIRKARTQALVFTNRKATADFVSEYLNKGGITAAAIHSDMNYAIRKKTMNDFRNRKLQVLCATSVASRGIDIPSMRCVILYDIPDTKEELIHRTARTGRNGTEGNAWLLCNRQELEKYDYTDILDNIVKDRR